MPNIEHTVKTFTIDGDLQKNVDAMVADGWDLAPGTLPVAVYHLIRVKSDEVPAAEAPGQGAHGILKIDDSLVYVIPATETKQ